MSLKEMIKAGTTIDKITPFLDALSHEERCAELFKLGRKDQRVLWELAAASPGLDAEFFVPADTPPLTEVIHEGKNSLPLFRRFQKRFCRPTEPNGELFGYNEGFTRFIIGPGYYVSHTTDGNPEWQEHSAYVVDYFMVPERPVVEGWPKVKPNSSGLQMFVYKHTRDFMRGVSAHASIGKAYKNGKELGAYFILCRTPAGA